MTAKKGKGVKMASDASPLFLKACELAGVQPTRRQYKKYMRSQGCAWEKRHDAHKELKGN